MVTKLKEQHADHYGRVKRASLPREEIEYRNQQSSSVRVGTSVGIHPENTPYTTTQRFPQGKTDEDETLYPQRMPSSTRKYVQPRQQTLAPRTRIEEEPTRPGFSFQRFLFLCAVVIALATALAIAWFSFVVPELSNWHDNMTYSYPRIYQANAPHIGHLSGHFIAVNNNGTIELLQIPDHPEKEQLHLYIVSRFADTSANLIPITDITFNDMNGDGYPDIEVVVNGTMFILFDDGKGNFSLTPPKGK